MVHETVMSSVGNNPAEPTAKQKNKNNRNGYRAKELAEIRNSLRPFEQQGEQLFRNTLRQLNTDQINNDHLRQLNGEQPRQLNGERHVNGERHLNGDQFRQLNGEIRLNGDIRNYDNVRLFEEQFRHYETEQLRSGSSLSESSSGDGGVATVQETLQDTLNKLALMGYDEVGDSNSLIF